MKHWFLWEQQSPYKAEMFYIFILPNTAPCQVWLLYQHLSFKHCTLKYRWDGITYKKDRWPKYYMPQDLSGLKKKELRANTFLTGLNLHVILGSSNRTRSTCYTGCSNRTRSTCTTMRSNRARFTWICTWASVRSNTVILGINRAISTLGVLTGLDLHVPVILGVSNRTGLYLHVILGVLTGLGYTYI